VLGGWAVLAVLAAVVALGVWALVVATHPEVAGVETCGSRYVPGQGPRFSCSDSSAAQARLDALLGLGSGEVTVTWAGLLWLARVCLLGPVVAFVVGAVVQWVVRPTSVRGQLRNARLRRALRRRRGSRRRQRLDP
jgi:hypothetical protein